MIEKQEHDGGITVFKIEFNLFRKNYQDCSSKFSKYKFKMYLPVDKTSSLFSLGSYFPFRSWYRCVTAEMVYACPSIVTLSPHCRFCYIRNNVNEHKKENFDPQHQHQIHLILSLRSNKDTNMRQDDYRQTDHWS
jgi:hypothetical protein